MSTHKRINIICVVAIIIALILTVVVMNFSNLGVENANKEMGYETKIFDTSKVHTINIEMDDWDGFIETCENEEYTACAVTIDDETFNNVGIRAKGNTSLSNVSSMDSERYSFKVEFDQYDSGVNYHGLDKLSLNNIIQDNTYMKDYLTYQMMNKFGVDSPLCSFVYITVNGEDWGLYLAVEGVEDSFLQRNFGSDYGELYKPDSMEFGGGRGNGKEFNMDDFNKENSTDEETVTEETETENSDKTLATAGEKSSIDEKSMNEGETSESTSENTGTTSETQSDSAQKSASGEGNTQPNAGAPDRGAGNNASNSGTGNTPPDMNQQDSSGNDGGTSTEGFDPTQIPQNSGDGNTTAAAGETGEAPEMPNFENGEMPEMPDGLDFGGMGSGATLEYIDDEIDSYSTVFDSAKTDITKADKTRLIASLKSLSEGENLENVLDIEKLMRYFVVHNYVVNGDSYTGSMIHNYYLYEKNGQLSMIPWDYNLAFGGFQSNNATDTVNDPIDSPLNVTGDGSKPMIDWIFSSDEYTEQYHEYFKAFLEEVDVVSMIEETYELISPYVEKDPTAFCTYDEFEKGVSTLKSFCQLRNESISGQLDGSIPSTDEGRQADNSNLVDASSITISDMGSMGMGGGGMPDFGGQKETGDRNLSPNDESSDTNVSEKSAESTSANTDTVDKENKTADIDSEETASSDDSSQSQEMKPGNMPEGMMPPDGNMPGQSETENIFSKSNVILLGVSLAILIAGIIIAARFRRR